MHCPPHFRSLAPPAPRKGVHHQHNGAKNDQCVVQREEHQVGHGEAVVLRGCPADRRARQQDHTRCGPIEGPHEERHAGCAGGARGGPVLARTPPEDQQAQSDSGGRTTHDPVQLVEYGRFDGTGEEQYLDLLQELLDHGDKRMDRTGVGTLALFGRQMRFDLSESFPILTTKIIESMLWRVTQPLARLLRWRMVANDDSITLVVRKRVQWTPGKS